MRDKDRRACSGEFTKSFLDQNFGFGIDARGRFIEDQNFRIGCENAREG